MRGMVIASTQVTSSQTISSITDATHIVMSAGADGSGTSSTTFKIPAGKNVDIFGVISSGALVLRYGNFWTGDNTRADTLTTQDGIQVNNALINSGDYNSIAAKQGRYLGTVRTTATAGQTEDSFGGAHQAGGHRYVWNMYNRRLRSLGVIDTTATWTYTSVAFRQANNNSGNKVEAVLGLVEDNIRIDAWTSMSNITGGNVFGSGIGIDATTTNSAQLFGTSLASVGSNIAIYYGLPSVGYHAFNWLESSAAANTTTWQSSGPSHQAGMLASIIM
jgi:hypothetical protein